MTPLYRATAVAALAALAVASPAHALPGTLRLGFLDDGISFDPDPATRLAWLDRIVGVGADRTRINVLWANIATRAPGAGEDPADPGWPGYSWGGLDTAVQEAVARRLVPILTVSKAPPWAEAPGRAPKARPGTWRPDARALGAFARALAVRYSGGYANLPVVRYWQAWNEPNLSYYLTPQWSKGRPASPAHYRELLNAMYAALKSVSSANVVVGGGTAPFGDPGTRGQRMMPALFVREFLCLRGRSLGLAPCPDPARFDILAHHPYSVRGPWGSALNEDDVCVPDLVKLTRPLRRAERTGRALGSRHHRLWVTEISWDSSPPDPYGVSSQRHARWLEEAFYVLWRQNVDTVIWQLARDQDPVPSYGQTYQSGVFRRDGRPKPAARAFAFPFVAEPVGPDRARLWGRAPIGGVVEVRRRADSGPKTVARFQAAARGDVFTRIVRMERGSRLYARAGRLTSLTWTVR